MDKNTSFRLISQLPEHTGAQIAIFTILVAATYLWTLDVPFYLDDFSSIPENPAIYDPSNLAAIWGFSHARFVGYFSLSLNYYFGGEAVAGYHLVNIGIHLFAGIALWVLLKAIIRSPALEAQSSVALRWLPMLATLLFLLHPLQTQAVTYIVQRLASLTALFYLASLASYAWARLESKRGLYLAALLFGVLAIFTKQNAATLPAAILLLELVFFHRLSAEGRLTTFVTAAIGLALLVWLFNQPPLASLTSEHADLSRLQYFATQSKVLWHYISSFFYPLHQRIEFDIAPAVTLGSPGVALALAAHGAVIFAAYLLWPRWPLATFGILFYYLTHLVESSFLPIVDLAFEHRTYLPNAGLSIACIFALLQLSERPKWSYAGMGLAMLILCTSAWLTFERNQLWRDPIAMLTEETRISPNDQRAWTGLGKEHMRRGQFKEALHALGAALNLARTDDGGLEVHPATLLNAILALHYTEQYDKAFNLTRLLPLDALSTVDRSRFHEASGLSLVRLRKHEQARKELLAAQAAFHNPNAIAGLAFLDLLENDRENARRRAENVLAEQPEHPVARQVIERLAGDKP